MFHHFLPADGFLYIHDGLIDQIIHQVFYIGVLKKHGDAYRPSHYPTYEFRQPDYPNGVAACLEKIILDTDLLFSQHLLPYLYKLFLYCIAARHEYTTRLHRMAFLRAQSLFLDLTSGRKAQFFQLYIMSWQPLLRECVA